MVDIAYTKTERNYKKSCRKFRSQILFLPQKYKFKALKQTTKLYQAWKSKKKLIIIKSMILDQILEN